MQNQPVKRALPLSGTGDAARRKMRDPASVHEIPGNRKQRRALYLSMRASGRENQRRARQKEYIVRKEVRSIALFLFSVSIATIVCIAFASGQAALLLIVVSILVVYGVWRLEGAARRKWQKNDTRPPKA